jgi:hypothetical protein
MTELEVRYLQNIKGEIIGEVHSDGFSIIYNEPIESDSKLLEKTEQLEKEKANLLRFLDGKPTHWSNILYDKNKEIEKLETKIKLMNDIIGDKENSIEQLEKENAMMRKALEYIAKDKNCGDGCKCEKHTAILTMQKINKDNQNEI